MPFPITYTFARAAMPSNLLTVPEWRKFAREAFHTSSWAAAARRYARIKGGALVLRADGRLVSFTLREGGKVTQRTYREGEWRWHTPADDIAAAA